MNAYEVLDKMKRVGANCDCVDIKQTEKIRKGKLILMLSLKGNLDGNIVNEMLGMFGTITYGDTGMTKEVRFNEDGVTFKVIAE